MRALVSMSLVIWMTAADVSAQATSQNVDLKSPDGVVLKASYYSPGKRGPGIVLFHQCSEGASRRLWDRFAKDLVDAGFHVITFDFRGYGDTGGPFPTLPLPPPPGPGEVWGIPSQPDVDGDAALAYLTSQKNVDRARLATGGASCGALNASNLAARTPSIKALLLLSGLPSTSAVGHIGQTPSLAVFVAFAEQDMGDSPIRKVAMQSKSPQSVTRAYPGADHGVALLSTHPELTTTIVKWLEAQLK
jgi:dienelactone hydrolase